MEGASSQSHRMLTLKQLKLEELRTCVLFQKPDLVCIVESWLSEDATDNEILLHDYIPGTYRFDRNRHGGGIVLYAHNFLSFKAPLNSGPHT